MVPKLRRPRPRIRCQRAPARSPALNGRFGTARSERGRILRISPTFLMSLEALGETFRPAARRTLVSVDAAAAASGSVRR
jgi:hypothetical protein